MPARIWRLDRKHLVDVDVVVLKGDGAAGHVESPHSRSARADVGDCLVPVLFEVPDPMTQRKGIVLSQILHVANLESMVLKRGDDSADLVQFPVGEHVAIHESRSM